MKHRILIADDDEQILSVLKRYLGDRLGYDVTAVATGEEAIQCGIEKTFDLAILDSCLPSCSSVEIFQRLTTLQPNLETIFFTGNANFERTFDKLRFSLPKDRVLLKPLRNLAQLTQLIISILGPPTR